MSCPAQMSETLHLHTILLGDNTECYVAYLECYKHKTAYIVISHQSKSIKFVER